jgi:hypothetical protein
MVYYLVQNDASGLPQNLKDAVNQSRGTMEILNEFREPTNPATSSSKLAISSPITGYVFFSIIFIVIAIIFFYWRYKRSQ